MERLYLHTGMGTPRDPPVRAGHCGMGSLGPPARAAIPVTRTRMSGFEDEDTHNVNESGWEVGEVGQVQYQVIS